jgi:hypothetical protein
MSHAKTTNHKRLASMFNTLNNPKPGSYSTFTKESSYLPLPLGDGWGEKV